MFFALLQKNRKRNMTTPEETRDRIKEMRERIFQVSGQDSVKTQTKENTHSNELMEKKSEVSQKNELPSSDVKLTNSLEETSSQKLQQNGDRISSLSADTQRQMSELALEFTNKSDTLKTEILSKLEQTFAESNSKINRIEKLVDDNIVSLSQANDTVREELKEFSRSLQLEINSVIQRFSSANEKVETDLQNSFDKLSKLELAVEDRQNSLEETFSQKLQQNGDRISSLSADTQRQISEIALEFTNKSDTLEKEMLGKLEQTFAESNSKVNGIEKLVGDNIVSLSQANKALKERLSELDRSLQLDINSVTQKFSSANEKIETKLQKSIDKLAKFKNAVEDRQNSLEETFSQKLQQNGDRISSLSADTQRQISEIALELTNKSDTLEKEMLDKIERISFHLGKVEEQIENQIGDLSTSLQKYVVSITSSQEDKIDTQAKKIHENVALLKQEIFEYQRDLKADFNKKIKESELKSNNYLSEKISEVRDQLSDEIKLLSGEINILNNKTKEKHAQLAKDINNNVSSIDKVAEKDRKNSAKQFEKLADTIHSVESLIIKEEDLIELFQNYTLNVNISDTSKTLKK